MVYIPDEPPRSFQLELPNNIFKQKQKLKDKYMNDIHAVMYGAGIQIQSYFTKLGMNSEKTSL